MKNIQPLTDKLSIGLSIACSIHCLALPVILALLPSLTALQLDNEEFHIWMVMAVLPISLFSLFVGCNKHKDYKLLAFGAVGLAFLVMALLLEDAIGEIGEKAFTLIGSIIIALVHFRNFRLCQKKEQECGCS